MMIRKIKETDYPVLTDIWESAVLTTHDFLKRKIFCITKSIFLLIFSTLTYMVLSKAAV